MKRKYKKCYFFKKKIEVEVVMKFSAALALQLAFHFSVLFCNENNHPSIDILTRTYHKDGQILFKNLISTYNLFVNRNVFKLGVVLDDESVEDHYLGALLLEEKYVDYVHYEPLPPNHLALFQALAFFPHFSWGYDRQQWSTFYMDLYSNSDIIGVVDSDSTFFTYLTYEDVLTEDGRIRLHAVAPIASWNSWLFPYGDGSQYCNDKVALGFDTPYDLMSTIRMPMFFWRSTYINLRKYIEKLYGMNFDEAYKLFSRNRYCQFNIIANYAIKFEPEKYAICDQLSSSSNLVSIAQNGCPNTRDILVGGIRSFRISKEELPKRLKCRGHVLASSTPIPQLKYRQLLNDATHINSFSCLFNNPCEKKYIDAHYQNVRRDIEKLSPEEQEKLKNNFLFFLRDGFNDVIIK